MATQKQIYIIYSHCLQKETSLKRALVSSDSPWDDDLLYFKWCKFFLLKDIRNLRDKWIMITLWHGFQLILQTVCIRENWTILLNQEKLEFSTRDNGSKLSFYLRVKPLIWSLRDSCNCNWNAWLLINLHLSNEASIAPTRPCDLFTFV